MSIRLEALLAFHGRLCAQAASIIGAKGHDYCADAQAAGDTLGNLRLASELGIVDTPARSALVRLADKLMRLVSLTVPGRAPAVAQETLTDTVVDLINYAVYVAALEAERTGHPLDSPTPPHPVDASRGGSSGRSHEGLIASITDPGYAENRRSVRATTIHTRVYIAGPYSRGNQADNIRTALDAADAVWKAGHFPFVPHLTHLWHLVSPKLWLEWLAMDCEWLSLCHAVIRLPGESDGADQEVALAGKLSIPVFHGVNAWLSAIRPSRKA